MIIRVRCVGISVFWYVDGIIVVMIISVNDLLWECYRDIWFNLRGFFC